MILAINAPQSKTVSISFTLLKGSIFAFISHYNAVSMSNNKCTIAARKYFQLLRALLPLCILVNLCFLLYFYFSQQFKKMFFCVYYVFHWIITLICMMGGLYNLFHHPQCLQSYSFVISILSILIIGQINTLIAMIQEIYFVLKYIHFGSNLVWLALWYSTQFNKCIQAHQTLIAFLHAGLSIVNAVNLLFSKLLGSSYNIFGNGRMLIGFSLFLMLICYLLILLQGYIPEKCNSAKLFHKNYMSYGLVELISPLLLLIFLHEEPETPLQNLDNRECKFAQYQQSDFFQQN